MSHTPYYYAPGGTYVLFLDLLGFTAFVRSSFQKKAEETDDREKEFELAQKQFKIAQAEVDREYRRFHEHLEELLRQPSRRGKSGKSPAMSLVFSDCAYVVFDRSKDAVRFAVHAMRSFILAFAKRALPRASDRWVQALLDYKQRLQQLFFPEGIAYDGNRFNRTAATAPLFNYLAPSEDAVERVVSREGIVPERRGRRPKPECLRTTRINDPSASEGS